MSRLPTPGGDDGQWGQLLNDFLSESHNSDGSLKDGSVTTSKLADGTVTTDKIAAGAIAAGKLDSGVNAQLASASTAVQTINGQSGTSITLPIAAPTVTRTYMSGAYPARNTTGVVIWVGPTAPTFGANAAADGDMWINNS